MISRPAKWSEASPEEPIRSELFGVERLELHGESLARAQTVRPGRSRGKPLLPRVEDNGRVLRDAYRAIVAAIRKKSPIVPAAERFIDSFHIVDEQLREIRDDLPAGFYRELPKLSDGPLDGLPRVYGLAWAYVAHTDSRFDPESLRRFVVAYQRVQPLTIGELWAVTISLRIVLVENLRRLAESMVRNRVAREEADRLADDILGLDGTPAEKTSYTTARLERTPLRTAFAVQLVQRLREQDPATTPALLWLDRRLAAQGTDKDEIVRVELQRQAAMNVTVRNIIQSMGLISSLDWTEFFESVSLVDRALADDADYGLMDFTTRDSYRHAVEELARGSGTEELFVARAAISRSAPHATEGGRLGHVGFHLVGRGRRALEVALGFRVSPATRLVRAYVAYGTAGYLGTNVVLSGAILALPWCAARSAGASSLALAALAVAGFFPATDLAMALVNRMVAAVLRPALLPRFALKAGVPASLRTMVVMPSMLTSEAEIEALADRLEVHFLANADGDVAFALLTDWNDSAVESAPEDAALLASARRRIAALNARYGAAPGERDRFLLLHRTRRFNACDGLWMGWERKRGKLHELNRLLRGAVDTSYLAASPDRPVPTGVKYVVTLDADTALPRGALARLVGTMTHPLNRPRFDPALRRVTEGYGVLQPRITSSLPGRRGSIFQRITSGPAGVDPYSAAVSDVYQDLFGEGSYAGKGIYDVDAFEAAMAGRAPENSMLSHDLFEGVFARAGLVADIEVFEHPPSHYGAAAARQHRWARGDWQLLPWILKTRMPLLGRWKMIDNLRRTLSAPASVLTLTVGWTALGAAPGGWTALVVAAAALPALLPVFDALRPQRSLATHGSRICALGRDFRQAAAQSLLQLTMTAHQAVLMTDAVCRTLVRICATRRGMLEWTTAARSSGGLDLDARGFHRRMLLGCAAAAAIGVGVDVVRPESAAFAAPFVVAWLLSPLIARLVSLPGRKFRAARLGAADRATLRTIARSTWRYFEAFVGPESRFLPPDNFQEDPRPTIARRTSPTNMGLYLLSVAAARDFGWIGTHDAVERVERTLASMRSLVRFRGHFYNWYETTGGAPLEPRYVSTVDSGNLAGHCLTLAQALREFARTPTTEAEFRAGLIDVVALLSEAARAEHVGDRPRSVVRRRLLRCLRDFRAELERSNETADGSGPSTGLAGAARTLVDIAREDAAESGEERTDRPSEEIAYWSSALSAAFESRARDARPAADGSPSLAVRLEESASAAEALAAEMDFTFLFDPVRKLFAIGYRGADGSLDAGRYDLLASEARLTSFLAVAAGSAPVVHWFRLGRPLASLSYDSVLMSWSGSMFEYLMPGLVMREPAGGLLEQTCRRVVRKQIDYGRRLGVPWGASESAYNARDLELTYQYSNFGVPGLGFRRGLRDDVVVAPYATALASMYVPGEAVRNFARIAAEGGRGRFGFFEALDYTPARLPERARVAVVRAYMAHHQGMSLVALDNVVHGGTMRNRFHDDPRVRATELLLQERTPRDVATTRPPDQELPEVDAARRFVAPVARRFTTPHGASPVTHLLSNGRYAVMITAAGGGYSRRRELGLTRWREDATRDVGGVFVYLRDRTSGRRWSAGHHPTCVEADAYEATFSEDRARISRRDGPVATTMEVLVSPEDDAEIRRVSVANRGSRMREIEVTCYLEPLLTTFAADAAHPAFSNLFIETEWEAAAETLLASRRPRSPEETRPWLALTAAVEGESVGPAEWESDRGQFIGRGRSVRAPLAMEGDAALTGTVGAVTDPVLCLRRVLRIPPGGVARVAFALLHADSREKALALAANYRDVSAFDRATTLAWTQAQVQLRHLGIGADEADLFQRLAQRVIFSDRSMRPPADVIGRDGGGASSLWSHGISGDVPILLVRIDDPEDLGLVRQLLRAHEYWSLKQLSVDLVILNERASSYVQDLQSALEALARSSRSWGERGDRSPHGGVFVLRADRLTTEQTDVLLAAPRAVIPSRHGTLAEQLEREQRPDPGPPLPPRRSPPRIGARRPPWPTTEFFNGLGAFTDDGREYLIRLEPGRSTPAPWINVVANPGFGFQTSETGAGFTWAVNSRENQLTTWSNDPVVDPCSEAIFISDLDDGEVWCPTAAPIREPEGTYETAHGHGYSRFAYSSHGIVSELVQFVPQTDPIKISRLTLSNRTGRPRRLAVTTYVEWSFGASRSAAAPYVVTSACPVTGALLARSAWRAEFRGRVAFLDLSGPSASRTGDRAEFLGRNGGLHRPAALFREGPLSGRTGAGLDPCGAIRREIRLRPGESISLRVLLGEAARPEDVEPLVVRYREADLDEVLRSVRDEWSARLEGVRVRTPDRSLDLLLNGRLLYQTLACRVFARSAFYQAGGAYGFRDQLQDAMALATAVPSIAREHLVRASGRQFREGDFQHWWHPPTGRGVRTRIADDAVWLAFVADRYVLATGDDAVLEERTPFLEGPRLEPTEDDSYFTPTVSAESATIYEHCARGLDRSLDVGARGLPLMGGGDWNDGMNRVGREGRGESVWLGWFLAATLVRFSRTAVARGDLARAERWTSHVASLKEALEAHAWDGDRYRRAFCDDGAILGSRESPECRIDAVAQSWSVLSGIGDPERARIAMATAARELIRPDHDLMRLLDPPFDASALEPGYIKGYPPGVRENGGQYTHGALWTAIAYAELGDGDRAHAALSRLSPIRRTADPAGVELYRGEPYVVAADVLADVLHPGRAGWTWYTGSAGWMYRTGVEWILGIRIAGDRLGIDPCIPRGWRDFEVTIRYGSSTYVVAVENPKGVSRGVVRIEVDGTAPASGLGPIHLIDDGAVRRVRVLLG